MLTPAAATRHEIAFVFGQLLSPHSVPALLEVLRDASQSEMVRHEAAEALGGIATPEVLPILQEWRTRPDAPRVVRESCEIAVDMWEVRDMLLFTAFRANAGWSV
jgi:deoxyhypusine monooxygenase